MISKEARNMLVSLAKIEAAISRIYERLSRNESFPNPVRVFWASAMDEELEHAKLFNGIREKALKETSIQIEISYDKNQLSDTVNQLKRLLNEVTKGVV